MVYVALLRGINVGGNNKVEMPKLKKLFEAVGCEQVKTYINTGNIIFNDHRTKADLQKTLEKVIAKDFKLDIKVLLVNKNSIQTIVGALPDNWVNNEATKCDVMFLWESIDKKSIINQLPIKMGIDNAKYIRGAVLWCVDRKMVTRSGLLKIVGTDIYKKMTIRNCNTVRKIHLLMEDMEN